MAKLTEAAIRNMKPGPTRREIPDGLVIGLYFVLQPTGVRSWAVRYRHGERPTKLTLGRYPAISLVEARDRAREVLLAVARGINPSEAARRHAAAEADTVAAVVDTFLCRHVQQRQNERSSYETHRLLAKYVIPAWGARRLG